MFCTLQIWRPSPLPFFSSFRCCLPPPAFFPPSFFLLLLFTEPPSRDDVPGSGPSARAPNSSGGGLESSALTESPRGRCRNKQTVTIKWQYSAPRAPAEMSTGCLESPQGHPDPGDALRAPLARVADCRGAWEAQLQPRLCGSESESPPPSLHRGRITATQLTAAWPTEPRPRPPAHTLSASLLARWAPARLPRPCAPVFCSPRGSGSPTFRLQPRPTAAGAGPRGCGARLAEGRPSPSHRVHLHPERFTGWGEKQKWWNDSGFLKQIRHSCAEGSL